LALVPGENSSAKLTSLLTNGSPVTATTAPDAVQTYFDTKTKDDFEQGHTVVVNGWILSQTEARQCALFSLL
jgi:hypothetical protein